VKPSGQYRHRVAILKPTRTVDSFGQDVLSFAEHFQTWALVAGNGGGTQAVVGRGQVTFSHTVTVRDCSELAQVQETWRVRFKGRDFVVSSIDRNPEKPREEIVFACTEEVPIT
jgi:SPP1 family predicted phage head-tail adaptor